MMEQHNMDWSSESSQSDPKGDNNVKTLLTGAFESLSPLFLGVGEVLTTSEIRNKVLDAYKQAHAVGQRTGITVSLVTILWVGKSLTLASVGVCKCYLVRDGRTAQINTDDYARLVTDKVSHTSSSMLSNVVGLGRIVTMQDIHLIEFEIEPKDVLVLGSESFNQNVPEEAISTSTSAADIDEVCSFLAREAIARTHPSDPLALCVIQAA
ncbi:MAG: hypothetical protein AABO41_23275 [Acidobacteriota bacterium]